jgi:flagellar basal-body rod protein FlgG
MNYGLYLSASGVATAMYRMDVAANNLANINTTAFKPDTAFTRQRPAAVQEDGLLGLPTNTMLERLGGGVHLARTRTSFTQGPVERTDNPLDVGLLGEGFLVASDGPASDPANIRLTRDGRLAISADRRLVFSGTGLPVLDTSNRSIMVDAGEPVTIEPSGWVVQAGSRVAQVQIATVADRHLLRKVGEGQFAGPPDLISRRRPSATTELRQSHLERSGVDPVRATLDMLRAERAVGGNVRLIAMHDELMNRAISTFSRIA